jgi:hypothetical protein
MEVVKKVRLKRLGVQIGRTLKVWGRTSAFILEKIRPLGDFEE